MSLLENLSPENKSLLQEELKKYSKLLNIDVKTATPEQIATTITQLTSEEQALSNRLIQLETQIQEKEKQIQEKEKEIKEKYGISDIKEIETLKQQLEQELEQALLELRNFLL